MALLKYWQPILSAIITAILSGIIGYGLHSYAANKAATDKLNAVQAQKTTDIIQCNSDKQISHEVANDYEAAITSLNSQLDRLRQYSSCTTVQQPNPARSSNGSASNAVIARSDEPSVSLNSSWLIDFAGRAEKYRLQLKACQSFIQKTVKP